MSAWAISLADVERARARIAPYLPPTPLRHYAELDAAVGGGVRVLVKHENHQPTNAFKVRNALAAVTARSTTRGTPASGARRPPPTPSPTVWRPAPHPGREGAV
jgi:threonine dehydratase